MNNKQLELANSVKSDFFATRASMQDAFDYAYKIIDALPDRDRVPAYTAMHVVINTMAQEIIRNETDVDGLTNLTLLGTDEGDVA